MSDVPTEASNNDAVSALQARIAALEAEKQAYASGSRGSSVRPGRWRKPVAAVLIILAAILTPVSIVTGWARIALTNTDAFVATYAPLASDPEVQGFVVDQVMIAIEDNVDIDGVMGELATGLSELLPNRPKAQSAILLLQGPAAEGVRSTIRNATTAFVASDAFAEVWRTTLAQSHSTLIATLQGDPDSLLVVEQSGLGLRLGPIVEQVKAYMVEQGVGIADLIPTIDKTVTIAHADAIPTIQVAYRLTVAVGYWLAFLVAAMFVTAVLISQRRAAATIGAMIGLALGALVVLGGLQVASTLAHSSVPAAVMPSGVLSTFYNTVGDTLGDIALGTFVLSLVVGATAWISGPFRAASTLREAYSGALDDLKQRAATRGISTGRFGEWLFRHRIGLRLTIGAIGVAALLLSRPLTAGKVFTTLVATLLAVFVLSLLLRRPPATPGSPGGEGGSGTEDAVELES